MHNIYLQKFLLTFLLSLLRFLLLLLEMVRVFTQLMHFACNRLHVTVIHAGFVLHEVQLGVLNFRRQTLLDLI